MADPVELAIKSLDHQHQVTLARLFLAGWKVQRKQAETPPAFGASSIVRASWIGFHDDKVLVLYSAATLMKLVDSMEDEIVWGELTDKASRRALRHARRANGAMVNEPGEFFGDQLLPW